MGKLSISTIAVAAFFAAAPASATDLGTKGDPTSADYQAPFSWSGFYLGGQIGYGISTSTLSTTTVTEFPAVDSRCWAQGAFNSADAVGFPDINLDTDPVTPGVQDDRDHVVEAGLGASITNVTEAECDALRSSLPATLPPGSGLSLESGYDPAVAAHSVTDKYVSEGSESGMEGGIVAGYDQLLFNRVVIGVFGEYNWSAIDGKDYDWAAGGRLGFLIAPRVMGYGLLGYAQADYGDVTFNGLRFGGGVEVAVTENVFANLQYTHTDYDTETLVNTPALKIDADLDEDRVMAGLKIKLNSGLGF